MSKHPQRAKFAAPNPENIDNFFVTEFDLYYNSILSFPNGSAAGPDKKVPQIFKDLVSNSTGSGGLNFLKSPTKLINLIGDGKIPEPLRPLFGAKLIALIKIDGGLRPITIGNTLRRIMSKCAGSKALSERRIFFGNVQVGCGIKRGAEVAAHLFRNLIELDDNRNCTVLLKLRSKNAFNSLIRETMLNHVYLNRPEMYNHTHCAYSKHSYLFSRKLCHNVRRRNSAR